ncbi:MAG: T9SS type A sorting domain-containing protein [Muribaculaceae bacterium]
MMRKFFTLAIIALQFSFAAFAIDSEARMIQQQPQAIEAKVAECISVSNQTVTITNNTGETCVFSIYCVTGQAVKSIRLGAGNHASFELPKGFYVVKCNNEWSRKIIVR